MVAVLMDAYDDIRIRLCNCLTALFHIGHFFAAVTGLIEALVVVPCQDYLHIGLFQIFLKFQCNRQVDILFQAAVHTDFTRIISAVAGIQDDYRFFFSNMYTGSGHRQSGVPRHHKYPGQQDKSGCRFHCEPFYNPF